MHWRTLLLVVIAVLPAAGLWWRQQPAPAPAARAPVARPPPARAADASAVVAVGPDAAARQLAAQVLASAVAARYLAPGLPAAATALLRAGDVAGTVRALEASTEASAPAGLAALAGWCQELGQGAAEARDDWRTRLAPLPRSRAEALALEQLVEADHRARSALADGCARVRFDTQVIVARLQATALEGNAASLERAALDGLLPPERLRAAALLGAPQAQFRVALELWGSHPEDARQWLAAAAAHDPQAAAYYANCQLAGCGTAPDPVAGQAALEEAARRGSGYALGLLASPGGSAEPYRWAPPDATLSPVPPVDPALLTASAVERYAWATLAAQLAADGCFGFDLGSAAEALFAAGRLESLLSPSALQAGRSQATSLGAQAGPALRAARGCL